jgi:hypothetical protein
MVKGTRNSVHWAPGRIAATLIGEHFLGIPARVELEALEPPAYFREDTELAGREALEP